MNSEIVEVDSWNDVIKDIIIHTTNLDFYRVLAAFLFERKVENVSDEQRDAAKRFAFAVKYCDQYKIFECINQFPIPYEYIERSRQN